MISKECEKCGFHNAKVKYFGNTIKISVNDTMNGYIITKYKTIANTEILLLTCEDCGYQWIVEPLDKKAKGKNDE